LGKLELTPVDAESFRVLLVDDSMINLKVLGRMMTRLGIKDFRTCLNGCEAMETLKSIKDPEAFPNLILSDLHMPEMDGYELIRHIREHDWFGEDITVVVCSADWTKETEQSCRSSGFDHALRKPISFSELNKFLAFIAAGMAKV